MAAKSQKHPLVQWIQGVTRRAVTAHQRCNQCGHDVKMLDDVCPHCGAFAPVRVPTATIWVIGVASLLALFIVHWLT